MTAEVDILVGEKSVLSYIPRAGASRPRQCAQELTRGVDLVIRYRPGAPVGLVETLDRPGMITASCHCRRLPLQRKYPPICVSTTSAPQ